RGLRHGERRRGPLPARGVSPLAVKLRGPVIYVPPPHPDLEAIASPQVHPSPPAGRGGHARRGPNCPLPPWWEKGEPSGARIGMRGEGGHKPGWGESVALSSPTGPPAE